MPGRPSAPERSGKAIAALVLGIVGVVLCFTAVPSILALVFGLLARRDVRRSAGRLLGRNLAMAGIVLGIVGILMAVGFYVTAALGGFDDLGDSTLADVQVGECVRVPDPGFFALDTQSCGEPHEGEVFAVGDLPDAGSDPYPGEGVVQRDVGGRCLDEFEPYVGTDYDSSDFDFVYVYPSKANWRSDDGRYVCIAFDLSGEDLDEPVRNSGR
jgi:Domain of unknown function (DUF4190)/Septum formation